MTISQEPSNLRCIAPERNFSEEIPSLYEGSARPEFTEHLRNCPACMREAEEYRQTDRILAQKLSLNLPPYRADCPENQLLADYLLDLLEEARRPAIKFHLKSCQYCQQEFALFEKELKAEPPSVRPSRWADSLLNFQRAVAQLVPRQLQPGLRGSGESNSSIFQFEDISVILQIFSMGPRKNDLTVTGIVTRGNLSGPALAGLKVRLLEEEEILAVEELDATANFLFELENLEAGRRHRLEIEFSDLLVEVPLTL